MRLSVRHLLYLCATLLLMLTACSGLAGEPRIVATIPPATAFPDNINYTPDIANGARLFAANCTRCHGVGGAGDGELVQLGQVQNAANFTDPAHTQTVPPANWFDTITNGRIDKLMPPWAQSLSEQERWDVALYVYTLPYTQAMIVEGQQLAQAYDSALLSRLSAIHGLFRMNDADIITQLATSIPEVSSLSTEQKNALAAYIRSTAVNGGAAIGQVVQVPTPIATEEVAAATAAPTNAGVPGTITGHVTNGTALGTVPPDTIVTLHIISPDFTTETTANAPIAADGSFAFTGVAIVEGANFFVSVPYRDRLFASQTMQAQAGVTSLDLPVSIYELTEDTSVISIAGMVTQIDQSSSGDGLEFLQVIRFRNNSDRLFTTTLSAGDSFASLVVPLPPGSVVLGFQGEERYVVLQEQSTVVDTLPVLPNEDHLIQLLYFVPYSSSAIIEQQVNYTLNGPVRILLGPSALSLTSTQLAPLGPETIGQRQFNSFGGTLGLQPGDVVSYTLNGQINVSSGGALNSSNLLPVLMLAAGSVLLLFVIFIALRQRYAPRTAQPAASSPADKNKLIDALVRQIAELDEQHDRGQINHDVYQQRRIKLKARLAELMDEQ
ncbi:MAG: cytochrome c [Anaerolineae bacterium]